MENTLIIDLGIFLGTLYGGLIAGFFYDIYKTIRYFSKPKKWITYLGDILFWISISILSFYLIQKINLGEIRGYIILGFLVGIFIYRKIFSRFIYVVLIRLGKVFKELLKEIYLLLSYPFKFLKKKAVKPIKKFKNIPINLFKELKKYKKIISSKK